MYKPNPGKIIVMFWWIICICVNASYFKVLLTVYAEELIIILAYTLAIVITETGECYYLWKLVLSSKIVYLCWVRICCSWHCRHEKLIALQLTPFGRHFTTPLSPDPWDVSCYCHYRCCSCVYIFTLKIVRGRKLCV